jgi:aryl-alcohol dehydrogenase-like predicted oxidoreductase
MKRKRLGPLEVSSLCFGGNVFGWTVDENQSFALLDGFVAGGGNFVDTADIYSNWAPGNVGGESETILGRWLKARKNRDRIVVATKVGIQMGPGQSGLSKSYILRAVEASLRRLQTDYIDLYISHKPDEATPVEETMLAYAQLLREGKIRAVGASNYAGPGLRQALEAARQAGLPHYQAIQPRYNLYDRVKFERELLPVCQEFGLAVTPYYALAAGFLSGKYRSRADLRQSPRGAGVEPYLNERGWRILEALDAVAEESSSPPAAVAVAWLLSKPFITAPIASATSAAQLEALLQASRLVLDTGQLARLERDSAE